MENELKDSRNASVTALQICNEWQDRAKKGGDVVRTSVDKGTDRVVKAASAPLQADASNIKLGILWLEKLARDNADQLVSLHMDNAANQTKLQDLTAKVDSGDVDAQSKLARHKDVLTSCKDRIDECKRKQQEVKEVLKNAQDQYDRMEQLGCVTGSQKQVVEQLAQQLSKESYKDFLLFQKGLPSSSASTDATSAPSSSRSSTSTNHLALALAPSDVQTLLDKMKADMEAKMQAELKKMRADLLVRNNGAGSDAGS
jgi:hypothetical protein